MPKRLDSKEQKIFKNRGARYGEHVLSHKNLGLIWTGLIQNYYRIKLKHPLPAFLVEAMMAANKLNRIAVCPEWKDSYDDARIYITMSEDAAKSRR